MPSGVRPRSKGRLAAPSSRQRPQDVKPLRVANARNERSFIRVRRAGPLQQVKDLPSGPDQLPGDDNHELARQAALVEALVAGPIPVALHGISLPALRRRKESLAGEVLLRLVVDPERAKRVEGPSSLRVFEREEGGDRGAGATNQDTEERILPPGRCSFYTTRP